MAISVLARKLRKKEESEGTTSSRVKRTGDLGKHLFPKYCMLCRKETPIQVNRKKQYPKLISLDSAVEAIKETAHEEG